MCKLEHLAQNSIFFLLRKYKFYGDNFEGTPFYRANQ